jgi:dTDP-4-dehydrorhamnose 3,5-epimerase
MGSPVTDASIEGVTLTPLREIRDERGAVLHMMRRDAPDFDGFGECYFSEVVPGAVKAWKRHREQTQNLSVPVGRMRLVIFDGREGSPSRGLVKVLEMGRPDAYFRVRIPPGLWYGFACIGPTSALLANCADLPHDPTESEALGLGAETIPYSWTPSDDSAARR